MPAGPSEPEAVPRADAAGQSIRTTRAAEENAAPTLAGSFVALEIAPPVFSEAQEEVWVARYAAAVYPLPVREVRTMRRDLFHSTPSEKESDLRLPITATPQAGSAIPRGEKADEVAGGVAAGRVEADRVGWRDGRPTREQGRCNEGDGGYEGRE